MRNGVFLAALALATGVSGLVQAQQVVTSEFFIGTVKDGVEEYTFTTDVPLLPDQVCYYWRVQLDRKTGAVAFTERFTLPAAPTTFGEVEGAIDPGVTVEEGGTVATRTLTADLDDGWFGNGWCISDGDPLGPHNIEVSMRGRVVGSFDFTVVEPGATPEVEPQTEDPTPEVEPQTEDPNTTDVPEDEPAPTGGKDKDGKR